MKTRIYMLSLTALFAGAAMAAEPTKTVISIEDVESFDIANGEYVQASGAYYRDGGEPDGTLHKGPVVNVGSMSIDGIFEVKASDQDTYRLYDVKKVSGAGEIRFGRGVYISQESNFSNFGGTLTLFTAVNEQGNRKGSGAYFLSGTNNPSNIKAFNLEENTELSFTNGNYTLNGKIEGAGKISARTRENLNFEGDKILENATPANVAIKGDISNFSGSYAAGESSSIKLETKLADNVVFVGWTGGTLELAGAAGDARKTITIDSHSDTTTSGNVFMYGNKAIIANNSRAGGAVDGGSGTIYFGGNNTYTQSEKLVYAFDKTTVVGSNAGHVTVGGKGAGSVMENGANITVDGVNVGYLTAGAAEGGVVNGDINVLVKSGEVSAVYGGLGGVHTGKTTITVEGGKVGTVAIGDYYGGKVNGDMILNVNGGEIQQVYSANYNADSETSADFNGVNGNVQINVSGGTVKNIRGGINTNNPRDAATAQSKMVLNGNVEINVSGNANISIDNDEDRESILAVGGSYGSVNGNTVVNISDNATVGGIIAMGGSRNNAAVKSTFLNVSGGTLGGDIYAGALKAATVLENTNITISGGTVNGDIYGGGGRADTVVKGNSNITLVGSTAKISGTIYGGGKDGGVVEGVKTLNIGTADEAYNGTTALKVSDMDTITVNKGTNAKIENLAFNQTGAVVSGVTVADGASLVVEGDITRNYNDITNSGSLVAGINGGDAVATGTVRTVIDGANTKLAKFYGGNGGNQKQGEYTYNGEVISGPIPKGTSTVGAVDITVNNGSISDFVLGSGAMHSDVLGNVDIKINGGYVAEIDGGACGANIGGDINITVNGGKVGNVFGGSCGSGEGIRKDGIVGGSTNVVIGGDAVITGNVYGGGWSDGEKWRDTVKGSTNITLKDNATVGGELYGGSMGGTGTIEGSKNLHIGTTDSAYTGSSALKVADFQKINIVNGSAEFASYTQAAEGTLITISSKGNLSVSVNSADQFTKTSVSNDGVLTLKRGELADSAEATVAGYTGSGVVNAFGGVFANGTFTAGKTQVFGGSAKVGSDLQNDIQSVSFADGDKKLNLDFDVSKMGDKKLEITSIAAVSDKGNIEGDFLGGFAVSVDNSASAEFGVVFSAYVGLVEDLEKLVAWHKSSGSDVWEKLETEITYEDGYASIIVDGFSSYAFSTIPEPATVAAIFGIFALGLAAYRKRSK